MKKQINDLLLKMQTGENCIGETANKLLDLYNVSGSLLRSKAKEYAKFKHQNEYNDPIYHRDVLETLKDFEAGYKAAINRCNDR